MPSETLNDQLRRIGAIVAACVVAAATLGTFALLKRIIPTSTAAPAPRTIIPTKTRIVVPPTSAAAASAITGGTDPVASAQAQTERELKRWQQQQIEIARRRATAINRNLSSLARQRPASATLGLRTAHTQTLGSPSGGGQQASFINSSTKPKNGPITGGAPVSRH